MKLIPILAITVLFGLGTILLTMVASLCLFTKPITACVALVAAGGCWLAAVRNLKGE